MDVGLNGALMLSSVFCFWYVLFRFGTTNYWYKKIWVNRCGWRYRRSIDVGKPTGAMAAWSAICWNARDRRGSEHGLHELCMVFQPGCRASDNLSLCASCIHPDGTAIYCCTTYSSYKWSKITLPDTQLELAALQVPYKLVRRSRLGAAAGVLLFLGIFEVVSILDGADPGP